MTLENLKDLYLEELRDIYDAEHQLTKALKKLGKSAGNTELSAAFEEHLEQTQQQIKRLESVFENNGQKARRKTCEGMKGLIAEGDELIEEDAEPDVLDAGLIAAAQRAEHYEISAYGTLCAYAELLGQNEDLDLLRQSLDEEKSTDEKLTKLAMNIANPAAMAEASSDGETSGDDLDSLTKEELYDRAQDAEVPGRSKMDKDELAQALRKNK